MAYQFTHAIKEHADSQGKLTMANGPLKRHCLYLPWLDVMGSETNWNRGGRWQPMSDEEMRGIDQEMAPVLSAHRDDILLNEPLFERAILLVDLKRVG